MHLATMAVTTMDEAEVLTDAAEDTKDVAAATAVATILVHATSPITAGRMEGAAIEAKTVFPNSPIIRIRQRLTIRWKVIPTITPQPDIVGPKMQK